MAVVIETTVGDITVDLYTEERPQSKYYQLLKNMWPKTSLFSCLLQISNCCFWFTACKNFLKLCKIKYYNFCLFHSIQANFIAQTGDPTGIGTGGESVFG